MRRESILRKNPKCISKTQEFVRIAKILIASVRHNYFLFPEIPEVPKI